MSVPPSDFYFVGGTIPSDAPSYVVRKADEDLLDGLRRKQFCYVLTSRQIGKSSLLVRTMQRLRTEGIACAMLDLTAIGQNLTIERWYDGLLNMIGWQFDLEDELDAFWTAHAHLVPLQRFTRALREVVLERISGPVALFVDEVDAVASLPFSADEFFAGIRECYNRRTVDSVFGRLTFAIFGVASPADLIRNPRTTPFNIGHRIELTDFTPAEATPLAVGLISVGNGSGLSSPRSGLRLLDRVLYWTGGHPYLTQRLCQAVVEAQEQGQALAGGAADCRLVDRLCSELFLSRSARDRDDNLLFVRTWLLKSEGDPANLLTLYAKVRAGRFVPDDETDPQVTVLKLAGVVRTQAGGLCVRNRLYARVFDRTWIETVMPHAEQRRQRAAYRRGVLRTLAVSLGLLILMGALAAAAFLNARKANAAYRQAEENARRSNRYLYIANMNLIGAAWEQNNVSHVAELLAETARSPDRNFEWGYWNRRCHLDVKTLTADDKLTSLAFSPDGKRLVTGSQSREGIAQVWDATTGQQILTLRGHTDYVKDVAFSPDGKRIVTGSFDGIAKVWDSTTGREIVTLRGHTRTVSSVAFSPDGKQILTSSYDKTARVWDATTGREIRRLKHDDMINSVAFSPDGKRIAMAAEYTGILDAATGREIRRLRGHSGTPVSAAFSPDGKRIVTGSYDRTASIWDSTTGREIVTLKGHTGVVNSVAFSPNGQQIVTGSGDQTARLWDATTGREIVALKGHTDRVLSAAFSPDGRRVATTGYDKTIRIWDATTDREIRMCNRHRDMVLTVAVSSDGKRIATGDEDRTARIWDATTGRQILTLRGHTGSVWAVAFSPDGKRVVTGSFDGTAGVSELTFSCDNNRISLGRGDVRVWDTTTGREILTLQGHTGPVWSAAFSPNGQRIVTGSQDGTASIWDATTGRKILTLQGHTGPVWSAAFSPDGKRVVTGSQDQTARLWDTTTGQEVLALKEHTNLVHSVAFFPEGTRIVSGSLDGTARVWDATLPATVADPSPSGENQARR
jgi:WD40 repeat protein